MPVKKRKIKKNNNKKIREEMRAAVNQIPALLAAESDNHAPKRDDLVEYEETAPARSKSTDRETPYDEMVHSNRMIWLWGAVSIFTVLVVIMWFLNTQLIVKKYTSASFNPFSNSQTELELVKRTLQSPDLKNAVAKIRVSNTDIEISEMLKKEIPNIIANLTPTTTPATIDATSTMTIITTSTISTSTPLIITTSSIPKFPNSNTTTIVTPSL